MQKVVCPNDLRVRVRKNGESKSKLLRVAPADLWRINADGGNAQSACVKILQPLLETPQLGVAEQSPITAIKNQHGAFGLVGAQLREADRISILVRQRELGRFLSHLRRSRGSRHLPAFVKQAITEERNNSDAQECHYRAKDFTTI